MPQDYRYIRTRLLIAYLVFMATSCLCILIRPDLFDHPDYGLSFFGSIRTTLVPYNIGLLTLIYCLWMIAKRLENNKGARPLLLGYRFGIVCLLGIVLTPMALHPVVWWTHIVISLALLVSQVAVVTWVLLQAWATWFDRCIGLVFFTSGIVTFLSGTWPGILTVYAVGELFIFSSNLLLLGRAAMHFAQVSQRDV